LALSACDPASIRQQAINECSSAFPGAVAGNACADGAYAGEAALKKYSFSYTRPLDLAAAVLTLKEACSKCDPKSGNLRAACRRGVQEYLDMAQGLATSSEHGAPFAAGAWCT
jgi:hypothetical protein